MAGVGIAVAGGVGANTFLGAEDCWDEEVAAEAEPFDQHRVAGAFIGREIEEEIQENRAEQRTTTTTVRRCR